MANKEIPVDGPEMDNKKSSEQDHSEKDQLENQPEEKAENADEMKMLKQQPNSAK
jgi:ribosomal protein S12